MSEFEKKIKNKQLLPKVKKATDCADYIIEDGIKAGWSGFTPVGYTKKVSIALAAYVKENNLQGKLNIFHGAHIGPEMEDKWTALNMVEALYLYQCEPNMNAKANCGDIDYSDNYLSMFPQDLLYGFYTKNKNSCGNIDIGLIEVSEIIDDGIILHGSAAVVPEIINIAEKIIIKQSLTTCNLDKDTVRFWK